MLRSSNAHTAVLSITAAVAAAALLRKWLTLQHEMKEINEVEDLEAEVPDGHVKLQLSTWDSHVLPFPATTTTTFYKGTYDSSVEHLRLRMRAMIKANPWLAGTLQHDKGNLVIVHPSADTITDKICDSFMHVPPDDLRINLSMHASERRRIIAKSSCLIPSGDAAIGKTAAESPLVRLIVAPCMHADGSAATDSADFVVLFGLSHMAGGGPTYYRLYSMLSEGTSAAALIAERVECVGEPVNELLGQDTTAWLRNSFNFKWNKWYHRNYSPPAELYNLRIDHDKADALKEQASTDGETLFVSTNDILCSRYAQMVGARMLTMPMDLRGRMPGVSEDLAGNYEQYVALSDSVCASPECVRSFLTALRTDMHAISLKSSSGEDDVVDNVAIQPSVRQFRKPLPNWWSFLTDRYCFVTNWASVHRDLVIPDCLEVCHGTAGDLETLRRVLVHDLITVYREKPGQLAIYAISNLFSKEDFLRCMPLKE